MGGILYIMSTIHVRPAASTMVHTPERHETLDHIYTYAETHALLEQQVLPNFLASPDYAIANVNGYEGLSGKVGLVTSLANPYSPNNLFSRMGRFAGERLYIVNCGFFDKINTIAILISAIIAMIIYFRSMNLNARQMYVFKDDADNNDPVKVEQLKKYNEDWSGTAALIGKTTLMAIPALIATWQIFKRTTVHKPGYDVTVEAKNRDKSKPSPMWDLIRNLTGSKRRAVGATNE